MRVTSHLENASLWARKSPNTFFRPSDEELDALFPGDLVKVCRNSERFWVLLTKTDGPVLEGTVNNHLIMPANADLPAHTPIAFRRDHIYSIG